MATIKIRVTPIVNKINVRVKEGGIKGDKGDIGLTGDAATNHLLLQNIGVKTHAQIDTDLTRLANTGGNNSGDQDLSGKVDKVSNISKGVILGDSTIAAYAGQNGVDYYLMKDSDSHIGTTITNNAVPGDTINQQKIIWTADVNKAIYDWVVVEIGLNDVGYTETDAIVLARYQSLIDTINADKKSSAIIVVATMTPAKARWIELFGSTNGAIAQTQWENMNIAIMGGGVNKITGVQYRVNKHTESLGDGVYNLANMYAVDLIHGNNIARNIIANSWREVLNKAQYLTSVAPDIIDKYFSSTGSLTSLKDGQFAIGSNSIEIGRMKVTNISGSAYNSLFTTNDYVFGSTGSSLLLEFGAPFGNVATKFSATSSGSYAWNNLIFQEGGGNVLIGSATDNGNKLQVNGRGKFESSVQVGDNTAVASASNVGAIRYRADANNSYADMCMQVSATTYQWVVIKQNTWV